MPMQRRAILPRFAAIVGIMLITMIGQLGLSSFLSSPVSASASHGTTLLLVHGFTDSCDGAFNTVDTEANATKTLTFLHAQGWGNTQTVGYYTGDSGCDANIQGIAFQHCTAIDGNSGTYGTYDDPIRHLGCLLAWYIHDTYTAQGRPVAVLAHSMGGLIIRDAIGESGHSSDFPAALDVRNVVTVATPHGGIGGDYLALAHQTFSNSQELTDLSVGSSFMQTIVKYQNPQGSAGTYWALMAGSVLCRVVPTGTGNVSCDVEHHHQNDPYPDGDGIVQADSALSMQAGYKVLYGVGLCSNCNAGNPVVYSADPNTQYSHETNSCTNVPIIGKQCLSAPFYLNDGTPGSQQTRAWICSSACNAGASGSGGIADLSVVTNAVASTGQPAPHSLAEIVRLLPAPLHIGTPQVTYVSPSMATFNNRLYVGWAGTDSRLNLMSSSDGVSFGGVTTISDTSIQGPSLAGFNNKLFLAWAGTDSAHHIYIQYYDGVHFGGHTALADSTASAPALAAFNGKLYLAWRGLDAAGHLNIESSTDGVNFGNKVTLTQTSDWSPALNGFNGQLVMAWTGLDAAHHLNIATSANGTAFTPATTLSDTSNAAPALGHNNGLLDLVWKGSDLVQHLNIESAVNPAQIDGSNKVTLGDTSGATPAVASFFNQVYLAWSGTDSPPHLYIAAEY